MRAASAGLLVAALATLAAPAAGQWPVGRGNGWAKLSVFHHRATEEYRPDGQVRPFLNNNGKSESTAIFADVLVGVTERIDVWLQVPYFDLNFVDDTESLHRAGIGDVRLSARVNLLQLRGGSVPISARFTVKAPINDVTIDAQVIPLGEGQWDYEAWLEGGISLWPLPLYSVAWLGYRWRTLNETTTREPGDELTFLAEIGGTQLIGGLGGKVVTEGLFGRPGAIQGVPLGELDRRQIVYIAPTAFYNLTASTILEVAARIPLHGKNFPAGSPLQIGVFHQGRFFD